MLIKKELATIPLLPPRTKKGRILEAGMFELPRSGEILVADYYKDGKLTARFFSDGTGYHTVFEWPAVSWTQAKPYGYYWESCGCCTKEANKLCKGFLKQSYSYQEADNAINGFIEEVNRQKRWKAEQRRYERMEQHIAMFPVLPESFDQYCEDHIFDHSYLFFSKLGRNGRRQGKCGSCGKSFRVKRDIKHNDAGICPCCGKLVTYKGAWYQPDLEETRKICVCYKVEDQLLIRWVNAIRYFDYPSCKRKYKFEDFALNLHLNTKKGQQLYGYVYQRKPYGYYKGWIIRGNEPCVVDSFVYTENLHEVFGQTYYNVDLKAGMENVKNPISFHQLLNALRDSPVAEYLFKLGMITLAQNYQRLRIDLKEGEKPNFSRCLGVNGQYRQMYSKLDINVQEHLIIKASREQVTEQDILDWRRLRDISCSSTTVTEWLPQMSFRKFLNYFEKQKQLHRKETLYHIVCWYRDYIGMSLTLQVDLSHKQVRFPKDIKAAHDQLLPRNNAKKAEVENSIFTNAVAAIYPALPFTQYEKDGFCIRLPQLRSDLTSEGQSLHHCVGGETYYKRHIAGESLIYFIRKLEKPEIPFFTMELRMDDLRIMQLYGYRDKGAPKEVRAFAESMVRAMKAARRRKSA